MSGIFYFAYGAMVHPVSRSRRGVDTIMETPAILRDYQLTFAYGGEGNIVQKRGWEVHGVLMECKTEEDWSRLAEFDTGYEEITVDVYPYDKHDTTAISANENNNENNNNNNFNNKKNCNCNYNSKNDDNNNSNNDDDNNNNNNSSNEDNNNSSNEDNNNSNHVYDNPVRARVFVIALDERQHAKVPAERLPQERYVKVIAEGMRIHGIDEEYIDFQIMNVPYIPNRRPCQYLTFPTLTRSGKQPKKISHEYFLKKARSRDWMLLGQHVIAIGAHDPDSGFVKWLKTFAVGDDCTWYLMHTLYDPDLPMCERKEDVTPLHHSWAENQMVEKFDQADVKGTTVRLLRDRDPSQVHTILMEQLKKFRNRRQKTPTNNYVRR